MAAIKLGIVGLGRSGYGMHVKELEAYKDKFVFVAGCDIIPERAESFAKEFGAKAYTDIKDLLADPEVELVDIATVSKDHLEHAKMALLAGKDVFLDKPFALNTRDARELVELGSREGGPRLFIRHNRRFEYGFEKAMELIKSGIIGDVFEIKLTRNGYQRRNDWQTLKAFGGGQVANWGPHIIDHSLQFCGGEYEELFTDLKQIAWLGDRDDHVKIVFKGKNGCIVDMEISGGAALPTPNYVVYGTKGAFMSCNEGFKVKYLDPNVALPEAHVIAETWPQDAGFGNPEVLPWKEEIVAFPQDDDGTGRIWPALYDAFKGIKDFPITLEQAYKVVEVIEKARLGTIFE